ncbi:MAG TPA: lysylphosphatidylglycerol synthase transmembrane domain-containing protein [Chloroflexota bacterium]|nr:lysylphosphatidylglycerol synthase transmembrane domain-containing protein [Chloroflexota bacterium]
MATATGRGALGGAALGVLGLAIGAGALALALRDADPARIVAAFARAGAGTVVLGTIVHVAVELIYAARWRLLIAEPAALTLGRTFGVVGLGYLANYTLPGRPGEVVRAALARALGGVPLAFGLASLVLEKVLDGATILLSGLLFALAGNLPDWLRAAVLVGGIAFAVGALGLGLAGALPSSRLLDRLGRGRRVVAFAARQLDHVGGPARQLLLPRRLARVAALGLASWAAIVGHQAVLCWGVGTGTGPGSWLLLYAALGLASVVPGAPGYLGTYQLAAVLALGAFGVEREPALVVATLYQLSRLLGALIVGGWALAREGPPAVRRALAARAEAGR